MNPLIQKLTASWKEAFGRVEAITALAATAGRDLTAEEMKAHGEAMTACRSYKAQVDALATQDEMKTAIEGLAEMKSVSIFGADIQPTSEAAKKAAKLLGGVKWSDENVFGEYLRKDKGGLEMAERKALSSTSDVDGGYLVTQEMANFIITASRQELQIEKMATVIRTNAGSFGIPTFFDENDPAIVAQNGTISEESLGNSFGKLTLTPSKLALLFGIPMELIEDTAFDLEGFLQEHFAYRFALKKESYYINGTGANQPLGLLGVTWSKTYDIAGATNAITPEDVVNAQFKLSPQYRRRAAWIMSTDTLNRIALFRSEEGGIGTGQLLWLPSFAAGQPDTILGKPLIESESFATAASDGDAMFLFGDLKTYYIAERIALSIQRLVELFAATDRIGYKMRARMDASPSDENAFVRYNRN